MNELAPMDLSSNCSQDHIIELVLEPPAHNNEAHRMLMADCIRLKNTLPSRLEEQLPGYYYKGPGELQIVQIFKSFRRREVEKTASSECTCSEVIISSSETMSSPGPTRSSKLSARHPIARRYRTSDPYPATRPIKTSPLGQNLPVESHSVFRDISNVQLQVDLVRHNPASNTGPSTLRTLVEESITNSLAGAQLNSYDEHRLQTALANGYTFSDAADLRAGDLIVSMQESSDEADTEMVDDDDEGDETDEDSCPPDNDPDWIVNTVTTVENIHHGSDTDIALYTTQMSWGTIKILQDGTQAIPPRCTLAIETGFGAQVPIVPWSSEVNKTLAERRNARSVSFRFPATNKLTQYPVKKCITYDDLTSVATAFFKDIVTFHSRTGTAGPLKIDDFPFRAGIAMNAKLLGRTGYDGVLSLGLELSTKEEMVVEGEPEEASRTLIEALFKKGKILVRTVFQDKQGILSLGGKSRRIGQQFKVWSDPMVVIDLSIHDQIKSKPGHQHWALYLTRITVNALIEGGDSKLPTPNHRSYAKDLKEAKVIAFDTGCRHSHFNADIMTFFQAMGLITIPKSKDGEPATNFTANTKVAKTVKVTFQFEGFTLTTEPFEHIILGTDLVTSISALGGAVPESGPCAIASLGNEEINVWGNRHMRDMAIGFHCSAPAAIQIGRPAKE
ncbi:hypothetical protein C8J56DRAFT_940720 [Mycena floridula]|nr:hypothetical protein C8J56DRAFT_940720 [Mycena floridula]